MRVENYNALAEEIKWNHSFRCRSCPSKFFYSSANHARKCRVCKKVESLTSNSALANSTFTFNEVIDILMRIQNSFIAYSQSNSALKVEYEKNTDGFVARLPAAKIAGDSYDNRTIGRLLKRLADWMPKKYHSGDEATGINAWYQGIKKENRRPYSALYCLLFDDDTPRYSTDILYFLIKRKWPKKS